jgi:hypothetical protein
MVAEYSHILFLTGAILFLFVSQHSCLEIARMIALVFNSVRTR